MDNSKVLRIIVVDDSAFMRSTLVRFFEADERFEVVGTASNGVEAVEKVAELKPDVMTLDIEMPQKNGIEALREIMANTPTRVVMVSSLTEAGAEATLTALELGAVDFLPKAMEDQTRNIFSQSRVLCDKVYAAGTARMSTSPKGAPVVVAGQDTTAKVPHERPQPGSQLRFKRAEAVLISVSTGGPKALQQIIVDFPTTARVPIIIVQHMPPNFTKAMAERLNEMCNLTVVEASDGQKLEANHIYVAPGGLQCRVKKSGMDLVFKVSPDAGESLYKPSVEVMGDSLLETMGGNVIAMMMTGMGNDGVKAFEKLKQAGAYIVAQDEATSVVYGMPRAVVEKGIANEVLPLDKLAPTIERLLG